MNRQYPDVAPADGEELALLDGDECDAGGPSVTVSVPDGLAGERLDKVLAQALAALPAGGGRGCPGRGSSP